MPWTDFGWEDAPDGWSPGDAAPEGSENAELTAARMEAFGEDIHDKAAATAATAANTALTAHTGDATAAHAASAISVAPTGGISATTAQAALAELDSEKQAVSAKGQANGYASLGSDGLVPDAQLPSAQSGSGAILPWVTGTAYAQGQTVTNSGHTYTANDAHTAGATFSGDLASHWTLLPVTKADVGLSSVDNTSDASKPVSTAQAAADALALAKASNLSDIANAGTARTNLGLGTAATLASDTDGTLAANSDSRAATQKAVKTYVDAHVGGSGGGRTVSSISYAASITPTLPASGDAVYNVGTLTGNLSVVTPSGTPADGQIIKFRFVQDATGGRTFTFDSGYAFGTDVQLAMFPTVASAKFEAAFEYDSTSSKWRCIGVIRGF